MLAGKNKICLSDTYVVSTAANHQQISKYLHRGWAFPSINMQSVTRKYQKISQTHMRLVSDIIVLCLNNFQNYDDMTKKMALANVPQYHVSKKCSEEYFCLVQHWKCERIKIPVRYLQQAIL